MTVGHTARIVKPLGWRVWVVGYLLWLIAFTVVDGTGRQVCRMPMQKWIDAAASPRDRDARVWFRDRANECLHLTRWYSFSMAGLFTLGLIAPLGGVWVIRRQPSLTQPSSTRPFSGIGTVLVFGAVVVVPLAAMLATMVAVRWAYDHLG
jgi:hypothetical protein